MPSIPKNVSASYSLHPVSGRLNAWPSPHLNHRTSPACMTNHPVLSGTSPASVSFNVASSATLPP